MLLKSTCDCWWYYLGEANVKNYVTKFDFVFELIYLMMFSIAEIRQIRNDVA